MRALGFPYIKFWSRGIRWPLIGAATMQGFWAAHYHWGVGDFWRNSISRSEGVGRCELATSPGPGGLTFSDSHGRLYMASKKFQLPAQAHVLWHRYSILKKKVHTIWSYMHFRMTNYIGLDSFGAWNWVRVHYNARDRVFAILWLGPDFTDPRFKLFIKGIN